MILYNYYIIDERDLNCISLTVHLIVNIANNTLYFPRSPFPRTASGKCERKNTINDMTEYV